jgi:hypothetical protein
LFFLSPYFPPPPPPPPPPGPPGPAGATRLRTGVVPVTAQPNLEERIEVTHGLGPTPVGVVLAVELENDDRYYGIATDPGFTKGIAALRADVPHNPYGGKFTIALIHVANNDMTYRVRWWAFAE